MPTGNPDAPGRPVLLLDERDAAASLGLTPRTLQAWRHSGGGPSFVRISSRCVRYRVEDLQAFARDRLCTSTSTPDRESVPA